MERITQRTVVFAVTLLLALSTLAMSAPKSERASKYLTVEGRVLQKDQQARTLLVAASQSDKLYLVYFPKDATVKITFGINMRLSEADFWHVNRNDRVRMRCIRGNQEHLARLEDGREVLVLTAVR